MSEKAIKRLSILDIKKRKGETPIVCLTAYTAPFAKILDRFTDLLLVGDSVGMVLYGMDSTLPVSLDMMIQHGKAVVKSSQKSCVVVDMPFGSYQQSKEQAFTSCARVLAETGCQAVKIEGGLEMQETVEFLVHRGIPVLGHVGLMPQMVNAHGGYGCQGKTPEARKKVLEDAIAIEKAGAFAVVIEGVVEKLASDVTRKLKIPVIGIGGSVECDGQILVSEDMAGLFTDFKPKFVKRYGNIADELAKAAHGYADEVKKRIFPGKDNCF